MAGYNRRQASHPPLQVPAFMLINPALASTLLQLLSNLAADRFVATQISQNPSCSSFNARARLLGRFEARLTDCSGATIQLLRPGGGHKLGVQRADRAAYVRNWKEQSLALAEFLGTSCFTQFFVISSKVTLSFSARVPFRHG